MGKKLYVGNLSYSVTEDSLNTLFGQEGTVSSVRIVTDKFSGKSKGFAFVEMESNEGAQSCIDKFDGQDLEGRALRVSEARERDSDQRGGSRDRRW